MSKLNPADFLRVKCSNCSKTIRAPKSAWGKTGKCPRCGTRIKVPNPRPEPTPAPAPEVAVEVVEPEIANDVASSSHEAVASPFAPMTPQVASKTGVDPNQVSSGIKVLQKRATVSVWLIRITILMFLTHLVVWWILYQIGHWAQPYTMLQFSVTIAQILSTILSAVFFLRWKHQANANLQSACDAPLNYSPGWCCGLYFIPILNLFRPMQAMNEIQSRSKAGVGLMVYLWWGCWVLGGLIAQASLKAQRVMFERLCTMTIFNLCLAIFAGFFLIRIIKAVTEKQRRYGQAIHSDPA